MIRRPPRSTLFPTRRSSDLVVGADAVRSMRRLPKKFQKAIIAALNALGDEPRAGKPLIGEGRSEEHTSELQSRRDLVCRLLLEKKKKKKKQNTTSTIHVKDE